MTATESSNLDLIVRLRAPQPRGVDMLLREYEDGRTELFHPLMIEAADEIERLNAQWEKAARLLNEFRPVTGTDEWVAVRVGALNYVLMAASPTPAVGPLVPAPESRDG